MMTGNQGKTQPSGTSERPRPPSAQPPTRRRLTGVAIRNAQMLLATWAFRKVTAERQRAATGTEMQGGHQ
jgi:hypothetical protein